MRPTRDEARAKWRRVEAMTRALVASGLWYETLSAIDRAEEMVAEIDRRQRTEEEEGR